MNLNHIINELQLKNTQKKIVFTNPDDDRVIKAVEILLQEKHFPVVCGSENQLTKYKDVSIGKYVIDSSDDANTIWAELLRDWKVDGMISWNISATADVVKALYRWVWVSEWVSRFSSYFLMQTNLWLKFFADCAVQVEPSAEQLAEIAFLTAKSAISFWIEPKVAMLSFSTNGSAKHESVEKIQKATELVKRLLEKHNLSAIVEWELQLDAAIHPKVALAKNPDSILQWEANVLIFPDLNSWNIGYKLVQQFGWSEAIGPILQWLSKPWNDLSRGCSVDDIIKLYYITANS